MLDINTMLEPLIFGILVTKEQCRSRLLHCSFVISVEFNKACMEVKRPIREAHRSYEIDIADKNKSGPKIMPTYLSQRPEHLK